jgi:hypothetical protein
VRAPFRYRARLGRLISAGEEKDEFISARRIIDAISRTRIDPQLAHAFSDRADIARIAANKPFDAHVDTRSTREITQTAQTAQPVVKHIGSKKLRHNCIVIYKLQRVKRRKTAKSSRMPMTCGMPSLGCEFN